MNFIRKTAIKTAARMSRGLMRFAMSADYSAGTVSRRTFGWTPGNADVTSLIAGSIETIRSRTRDMVRQNPWATSAVDSWVTECIGTGIRPTSLHPEESIKRQIMDVWDEWTERADTVGTCDFYGIQSLVMRSLVESGECLIRLRSRRPTDNLPVPVQLQIIEADHLPATKNEVLSNNRQIRAGVEVDAIGRRVAYHLLREHPGSDVLFASNVDTVRVPVQNIVHVFKVLRPGQLRGVPWLTPALIRLFELDRYEDAEIVRKKAAAMFAGFFTDDEATDNLFSEKDRDGTEAVTELEPGMLLNLGRGSITFSDPPTDPSNSYESFLRASLRAIAKAAGMTYEQVTGDLSNVNLSSIRAGLLTFRRLCQQVQQQIIVHQMCRHVWRRVITDAVLSGAINVSPRAFRENQREFLKARWRGQKWEWVDPLKDIKAKKEEIRAGLNPLQAALQEIGLDPQEVYQQYAEDQKAFDDLGLSFDTDSRQQDRSGSRVGDTRVTGDDDDDSETLSGGMLQ